MNLNKAIIAGRVTQDPETRMTGSGTAVSNFSVATNRYWTKDGQRQEETEFHNIVAWARTAEIVRDYLKKGQLVLIEGRLQTRSWEGQDGKKNYKTEIIAEQLQLGPKAGGGTGGPAPARSSKPSGNNTKASANDDIPVIDEDTVMQFDDEPKKEVDPKDIPF